MIDKYFERLERKTGTRAVDLRRVFKKIGESKDKLLRYFYLTEKYRVKNEVNEYLDLLNSQINKNC